jgi:transposase
MIEFQERFPNIGVQYKEFRDTLQNTVALFRETGSVSRKKGSAPPKKRNAEKIEEVQQIY